MYPVEHGIDTRKERYPSTNGSHVASQNLQEATDNYATPYSDGGSPAAIINGNGHSHAGSDNRRALISTSSGQPSASAAQRDISTKTTDPAWRQHPDLMPSPLTSNALLPPIETRLGRSVGHGKGYSSRSADNLNHHTSNSLSISAPPSAAAGPLSPNSPSCPNADALHIQRTYARISYIGGIPGDGFVDGVELTRDRCTEESITGYLEHVSPSLGQGEGFASAGNSMLGRKPSGKAFNNFLTVQEAEAVADRANGTRPSASTSHLPEAFYAHNSRARNVSGISLALNTTEEEQVQELRLLRKVDRYGFFAPTYGRHARLARLDRQECLALPAKQLPGSSSRASKSRKGRGTSQSKQNLPSPYISTNDVETNRVPSTSSSHLDSQRSSVLLPGALAQTPRSNRQSVVSRDTTASLSSSLNVPNRQTSAGPMQSALRLADSASLPASATPATSRAKETERISKWYREMLVPSERDQGGNTVGWQFSQTSTRKLRRRIAKGIPDIWRLAAWQALATRRQGLKPLSDATPRRYFELILQACNHDVQIDLDVPRTISGHLYFHTRYGLGQRGLFNVLHAFALLCPECGYCQGMGSVAATFLCYMPPERAYGAMVSLHTTYGLHRMYEPGFPGMLECFAAQEALTKALMPEVAQKFDDSNISVSSFATKWYITLFANTISFSTQLRIWDLFLLEGLDVLVVTATALIWALRKHILAARADFETTLSLLSSFFVPEDEDTFMRWIHKVSKRADCKAIMQEAQAEWRASNPRQSA